MDKPTRLLFIHAYAIGKHLSQWCPAIGGLILALGLTALPAIADSKIVFVTSSAHDGDLVTAANSPPISASPAVTNGLEAGDAICAYHAGLGGLTGTYKAWLSLDGTGENDEPAERFDQATVPYNRVDGVLIQPSWADLVARRNVGNPIDVDESGVMITPEGCNRGSSAGCPSTGHVWTNTIPQGTRHGATPSFNNCLGWTSSDSANRAGFGWSFTTLNKWTIHSGKSCNNSARLYCFQQDDPPTVIVGTQIDTSALTKEGSYAYLARDVVSEGADTWTPGLAGPESSSSTLVLYENGNRLGPAHTVHQEIRDEGGGRYSHWNDGTKTTLYFSSSDGTDPRTNGRIYSWTVGAPTLVFSEDFEGGAGPEWSKTTTSTTPTGGRKFLGRFGTEDVRLSLGDLPPHATATLSFDLFVVATWGGSEASTGPDLWDLKVVGGPTLLNTSFSNCDAFSPWEHQAYPDAWEGVPGPGPHPARTGASEGAQPSTNPLGFPGNCGSSVYHLTFTFEHADPNLELDFRGVMGSQSIGDESWGIDNVEVSTQ